MDTQEGEEEDEMICDDWSPVDRGRGRRDRTNMRQGMEARASASQNNKRSLEGNSSEEENRTVRGKVKIEEFKIIIKFRKEDEQINLSPITLTRELKKKVGEVEMAKILRDGIFVGKMRK